MRLEGGCAEELQPGQKSERATQWQLQASRRETTVAWTREGARGHLICSWTHCYGVAPVELAPCRALCSGHR